MNELEKRNDDLMMKIIETGNIEVLERFLKLKEHEETRQSLLEFDRNFALMQAAFVPAKRSKKGFNYFYAPLEELQKQFNPIISKFGFSYSWNERTIETGKTIIMTISGHGYSKEVVFDVPRLQATNQMNAIQVLGSMSTYGRRYTFISGFGIIIENEDLDGAVIDVKKYDGLVKIVKSSKTMDELKDNFKIAYDQTDSTGKKIITIAKDERKKELSNV